MGWLSVGICVFAAINLYEDQTSPVFIFAVIVAIGNFWSFGVMVNFRDEPRLIPNFWTQVNMFSTFIGVILLIYSFFE